LLKFVYRGVFAENVITKLGGGDGLTHRRARQSNCIASQIDSLHIYTPEKAMSKESYYKNIRLLLNEKAIVLKQDSKLGRNLSFSFAKQVCSDIILILDSGNEDD